MSTSGIPHLKCAVSLTLALNQAAGIWVNIFEQEVGWLDVSIANAGGVTLTDDCQNVPHDLSCLQLCQGSLSLQIRAYTDDMSAAAG